MVPVPRGCTRAGLGHLSFSQQNGLGTVTPRREGRAALSTCPRHHTWPGLREPGSQGWSNTFSPALPPVSSSLGQDCPVLGRPVLAIWPLSTAEMGGSSWPEAACGFSGRSAAGVSVAELRGCSVLIVLEWTGTWELCGCDPQTRHGGSGHLRLRHPQVPLGGNAPGWRFQNEA